MKSEESICERLVTARNNLGLKQVELANMIGVKQNVLSNYESGKNAIPDAVKLKLSYLKINIAWLITGEGEMLRQDVDEKIDDAANTVIESLGQYMGETDDNVEALRQRIEGLEAEIRGLAKENKLFRLHLSTSNTQLDLAKEDINNILYGLGHLEGLVKGYTAPKTGRL